MNQSGFSVVENLVAIAILAIAIAASSPLLIMSMHSSGASRNSSSVVAEVNGIIDARRKMSYAALLAKFGSGSPTSIINDQTALESFSSSVAKADFNITYTAIKSVPTSYPEAIRMRIDTSQRMGKLGIGDASFETIIAEAR